MSLRRSASCAVVGSSAAISGPLLGLVRSAVTSEHAAQMLRTFLAERVLGGIAEALHADHGELRMALAASQLVGIAVARYAVRLAPLAVDDDQLVGWVGPVLQYYLTGDVQPSAPGSYVVSRR